MNQKIIQYGSVLVIIIAVLISGYIILNPKFSNQNTGVSGLAPIINGKQEINMTVLAVDYSPRAFKVKAGVPVKWAITSSGQVGCASGAVFVDDLVDGPIYLNPQQGQVKVVEFTPQTPGIFTFACSMNMARGTIEVIN